jgi:hypothetical protein
MVPALVRRAAKRNYYEPEEGMFESVAAAATSYGAGTWAMMEGTNVNIFVMDAVTQMYASSSISFETYLGKIYNHGGVMANLFGVEASNAGSSPTMSAEAVAAYRKFLTGESLVEQP